MNPPTRVRGILHPGGGPLVRVQVEGVSGLAVLDTGASMSVIDLELARSLALPSPGVAEWMGVTIDGARSMSPLRTAHLDIVGDHRTFALDFIEVPAIRESVPGLDVLVLLGWDFLSNCVLTCDGPAGAFELVLPPRVRATRRRR